MSHKPHPAEPVAVPLPSMCVHVTVSLKSKRYRARCGNRPGSRGAKGTKPAVRTNLLCKRYKASAAVRCCVQRTWNTQLVISMSATTWNRPIAGPHCRTQNTCKRQSQTLLATGASALELALTGSLISCIAHVCTCLQLDSVYCTFLCDEQAREVTATIAVIGTLLAHANRQPTFATLFLKVQF